MSTPPSRLPPSLSQGCADANVKGRCPCGNCTNPAVLQTCLRFTKGSEDWTLVGCKPGLACEDVFPSEERREEDVLLACPCHNNEAPTCQPTPDCPDDAPVAPPLTFWQRIKHTVGRMLWIIALAAAGFLALKLLLSFIRHQRDVAQIKSDINADYTSMDLPPDAGS